MTETTEQNARGKRSAQVHDLTGRRMERHSPLLEEAWRYWSSLRSGLDLPRRDALDPRAMSLTLGHSMILDRIRPGTVRVRLGGRVVNGLMGMEVRGLPIRAFFEIAERKRAATLIERVFDLPATLEMDLIGQTTGGPLHARMLILPLRDLRGDVSKALTCVALDRIDTQPPTRFTILREQVSPLRPHPALRDEGDVEDRRVAMPMDMAEMQTGYDPKPKPFLRVVK